VSSYVDLAEAKGFLNVYYDEKDTEIQMMIDAAEAHVATWLNRPLSELLIEGSDSPPPDSPGVAELQPDVKLGVLMYVNDFWQNREITVTGTIVANNPTADRILHLHRKCLGV